MSNVTHEPYERQITRLVHAMSHANREDEISVYLAAGSDPSRVKMFVDGNLDKRLDKLQTQLEFVAEVFDDFDSLILQYMRSDTAAAYDTAASDGERMLAWLVASQDISPEQRDYIFCQQARHAIEELARKNRPKHLRFQELYRLTDRWLADFEPVATRCIHLNPIRFWSRFETSALLDDEAIPPADVLFFAAGEEIGTAILELEGQALINELADYQPCTLEQWSLLTNQADRNELWETSRDLAEMGLVAFG